MTKAKYLVRTASFAAVLAVAAAVTLTGCVSVTNRDKVDLQTGDGFVSGDPTSKENLAKLDKFAECMRDNGVSDFPDVNDDTGYFNPSKEVTSNKSYDSAFEDCKSLIEGIPRGIE